MYDPAPEGHSGGFDMQVLTSEGWVVEVSPLDVTAIERTRRPVGHPWKHGTIVRFVGSERHGTCYVVREFTDVLH